MKILIYPYDDSIKPFELEVLKEVNGINDYKFSHDEWLYFQYDCSFRPNDFYPDQLKTRSFTGYLISKSIKGSKKILEVDMKILEL
jgi:hypothetical protein